MDFDKQTQAVRDELARLERAANAEALTRLSKECLLTILAREGMAVNPEDAARRSVEVARAWWAEARKLVKE